VVEDDLSRSVAVIEFRVCGINFTCVFWRHYCVPSLSTTWNSCWICSCNAWCYEKKFSSWCYLHSTCKIVGEIWNAPVVRSTLSRASRLQVWFRIYQMISYYRKSRHSEDEWCSMAKIQSVMMQMWCKEHELLWDSSGITGMAASCRAKPTYVWPHHCDWHF
jgi:hypothetical protein